MTDKRDIAVCLWFDDNAEEAVDYYVSLFPDSRIGAVSRYGEAGPGAPGSVMAIEFELNGRPFMALNGGPHFTFDEAVSMVVKCDSQAEIDALWDRLAADGGTPQQCGWIKDRFGLPWQIVPARLGAMMTGEPERANRVMTALLGMVKLDMPALEAAYDGR